MAKKAKKTQTLEPAASEEVAGLVPKKRKKKLLGKNVYVVEEVPDGHRVSKVPAPIPRPGEVLEEYLVNKDGVCNCKASEFGAECKHVGMALGTYSSDEKMDRDIAGELVDAYLDEVLRPGFPRARIVNLSKYRKPSLVGNAAALACGVLSDAAHEKVTVWTLYRGLLIRVHCFRDLERYRAALTYIRSKWRG